MKSKDELHRQLNKKSKELEKEIKNAQKQLSLEKNKNKELERKLKKIELYSSPFKNLINEMFNIDIVKTESNIIKTAYSIINKE
jgi:septal ring factor EnvC (AmiA/AmiB activator)